MSLRAATWIALGAICCLDGAAMAGETAHRQLGAHQHGHGRLSIAVEGNKVEIELEVPGADIVGFEHEASTAEQKGAVEAARAKLVSISTIVKLPEAAGCRQVGGEVDMAGDHDHDDKAHDKAGADRTADAKQEAHGGDGHSEVHAEYWLECATPAALAKLSFDYFKVFAGASELQVDVVTARGASKFEVSRERPDLDLSGLL